MKKPIIYSLIFFAAIGLSLSARNYFVSNIGCQKNRDCVAFEAVFNEWAKLYSSRTGKADLGLFAGASNSDIDTLRRFSGGELPPDLEWLLRLHNGSKYEYQGVVFNNNRLNTVAEIISETIELQEINEQRSRTIDQPIDPDGWWHPRLLLVFTDQNGGGAAVDRRTGEVWHWDHDGGFHGLLAPNLKTFFEWVNLAIQSENYIPFNDDLVLFELDPSKADETETQKKFFEGIVETLEADKRSMEKTLKELGIEVD